MGNFCGEDREGTMEGFVGSRCLERCETDRRADNCLRFWWDLITAV